MSADEQACDLALRACDATFAVGCGDPDTADLIRRVFSGLIVPTSYLASAIRRYTIEPRLPDGSFRVSCGTASVSVADPDSLVFYLDKDVTLALQRTRRDLFFLHAAAVALGDRVAVLPAFPGTGKSTLTLALLSAGFDYLSDELAPIDLDLLTVQPYPHALCLKTRPPRPHMLPAGTMDLHDRFHIPIEALPGTTRHEALPVGAVIFLKRGSPHEHGLRPLTAASTVANLMAHALNSLAHPGFGLDAAITLSKAVRCFELNTTDLSTAVPLVKSALEQEPSTHGRALLESALQRRGRAAAIRELDANVLR